MDTNRKINHLHLVMQVKAREEKIISAIIAIILAILSLFVTVDVQAQKIGKYFNNVDANGVILDGYDAVAFFTDNKPVKGDAKFTFTYHDAKYQFASQEHLDLFKANPEKYAPQFGAWCAYAVSLGRIAPIDVNTFSIVDGRLFIQHNQRAVNGWNKDVPGNIVKADKYWPDVASHSGKQITTDEEKEFYNNINSDGVIMDGYDPVAYFTDKKAIKGSSQFSARYNGATYYFTSQEHADMFKEHPEMFAPLYGSFCGYAMAFARRRPVNPEYWNIVDGHLILQHSKGAWELFNKDIPKFKSKADVQWPPIQKENAGKKVKYDKPV
ncbi:MAG: YHS domain-containing protein [Chitinophagaceae bacterium]|nr:YHS domain-containing protein [Chitinophagaceae bacterium]